MREILFRGKRIDNGKWAEGFYVCDPQENYEYKICVMNTHPCGYCLIPYSVIPETIGQYTGLTDKNGIKLFEGDIVKGTFLGFPIPLKDDVFSICWQEDVAGYKANYFENIEVIGNIYDNPELLKGEE